MVSTIEKSRCIRPSISILPRPGHRNTLSMTMEPPNSETTHAVAMVTTGISALRNARI